MAPPPGGAMIFLFDCIRPLTDAAKPLICAP